MMSRHESDIRARRAQSNRAIADRDADRVVSFLLPDVTVAVAGGPKLVGRDASHAAFAEQFADKSFRGYVRDTGLVIVRETPLAATERGQWTGRWSTRTGLQDMEGTYTAEWCYTPMGWLIQSEVSLEGRVALP